MFSSRRLCTAAALISYFLFSTASAASIHSRHDHHDHSVKSTLPSAWFQDDNHPVHALFKRAPDTDGANYATVGSPTWAAAYPKSTPDPSQLPQAWVDSLNAAIAAGKIPNFAPSTATGGNPAYPAGVDPSSDTICSTTWKCTKNPDNLYNAPDGTFGISFDDGPLPSSPPLYQFLQENNQHATHFFIGVNILNNPTEFMTAFQTLEDDIAVHTWTHPYMSTLDNLAVLGQLGWTMEIIHNSTGGRIPKYWRPPYGDSDNRVNAIAKEVFGLRTVIWNQDSEDWSIASGKTTLPAVTQSLDTWANGPKSPGLITLEHELTNNTVQAFMDAYPTFKSNGWKMISLAQLDGDSAYSNSDSSTDPVTSGSILVQSDSPDANSTSSSSSSSSSTSSSSSSSTSSSPSTSTSKPASSSSTSTSSSSHSSVSSAPAGGAQKSGASSLITLSSSWKVHSCLATFVTILASAMALA